MNELKKETKQVGDATKMVAKKTSNIENLAALKKEYNRGTMVPRKSTMLKARLTELLHSKEITKEEQSFLELIYKREKNNGTITDRDIELYNRIEMGRCTEKCIVKTDDAPKVHQLSKDQICSFYKDEENERFVIFVEVKIPPEWQMTKELLLQEQRGHFPDESEYPKEKILIKRLNLSDPEFNNWFDYLDDLLSEEIEHEDSAYKF